MLKIAFRADGGSEIGMGHIIRCMALADAFPDTTKIFFIIKEEDQVIRLIKENGYDVITLNKDIDYHHEITTVKKFLEEYEINILIEDAYHIDQSYLCEVKNSVDVLVSISAYAKFTYPSDIVINGNVYASNLDYQSLDGDTKFLLGTDYALLRKEFRNLPEKDIKEKVKNILVTMGGSDPLNLTPKVLEAISEIDKSDFHVDVVIGPAFKNIKNILETVDQSKLEVSLHLNIKKISELMIKADLAISAGGCTLYELATVGTPGVVLQQNENQIIDMEQEGTVIDLGVGNKLESTEITDKIEKLIYQCETRLEMSKNGQYIFDGLGCERCAKEIVDHYNKFRNNNM